MKVAAGAVTAAVLSAVLRRHTPELAMLLSLAAGLWILWITARSMEQTVQMLDELAHLAGFSEVLLEPVFKTVMLSILTRLTAEICRGAGETGVAAFVELAGTVLAMGTALPLVRAVVELMAEMLT